MIFFSRKDQIRNGRFTYDRLSVGSYGRPALVDYKQYYAELDQFGPENHTQKYSKKCFLLLINIMLYIILNVTYSN